MALVHEEKRDQNLGCNKKITGSLITVRKNLKLFRNRSSARKHFFYVWPGHGIENS